MICVAFRTARSLIRKTDGPHVADRPPHGLFSEAFDSGGREAPEPVLVRNASLEGRRLNEAPIHGEPLFGRREVRAITLSAKITDAELRLAVVADEVRGALQRAERVVCIMARRLRLNQRSPVVADHVVFIGAFTAEQPPDELRDQRRRQLHGDDPAAIHRPVEEEEPCAADRLGDRFSKSQREAEQHGNLRETRREVIRGKRNQRPIADLNRHVPADVTGHHVGVGEEGQKRNPGRLTQLLGCHRSEHRSSPPTKIGNERRGPRVYSTNASSRLNSITSIERGESDSASRRCSSP